MQICKRKRRNIMAIKVLPIEIGNTDENQEMGNKKFNTTDAVILDSYDDVKDINSSDRICTATDYAVMTGVLLSGAGESCCPVWLRSAFSETIVSNVFNGGSLGYNRSSSTHIGLSLALHLDLKSFISTRSVSGTVHYDPNDNLYKVQVGEFPKTYVKDSEKLERLFKNGSLRKTGKSYIGYMKDDGSFAQNEEFVYNGQKYVRVIVKKYDGDSHFKDGTTEPGTGSVCWAKVEPITFKIRNWDDLPKEINPNGTGRAKFVDVKAEEAILSGLPFYPEYGQTEYTMWQNSIVRAYLNGYNLHKEIDKGNGNKNYKASRNFDFEGKGFLYEAGITAEMIASATLEEDEMTDKKVNPNPYGFSFDELDNDQLLKLYVGANASIFLHGPSGVGKSGRVKQLDPTATRITLRPQMNPEEVDGTLDRETGTFVPPLWYTQLCEKCQQEPNRKHVLFIDELTNVKPTVQSLIYSIVLDRAGKDGLWPLPENAVVVAAGNENEDNLAAYPLTNALFRRFSHIYYKVDKSSWLDWATGVSKIHTQVCETKETEPRARIHPAIVSYIMSRDENVLNQDLDEENPQIVTDPRKWEIASNVLYSTKNPRALLPAIGEDLTEDFVDFVQSIHVSVEDVLKGNFDKRDFLEMNISQKYSSLLGLISAKEEELPKVRGFISDTLGKELLASYDSIWVRNDPERAQIIAETKLMMKEDKDVVK